KQKENITRLLNGKKFRERRKLKALKHHLYNLGFTERALKDMKHFQKQTDNMEIRRLISWEMRLWHANKNTVEGAKEAVKCLPKAAEGENSLYQLRRIIIVTAECFGRLAHKEHARELLEKQLNSAPQPYLYLALANLVEDI